MSPPKDLPGFYFDPDKNRYFPIKGPIPGSKRLSSSSTPSSSSSQQELSGPNKKCHILDAGKRKRFKASQLLQSREVHGQRITTRTRRYNFVQEYKKLQASHVTVWKYQGIASVGDRTLDRSLVMVQTPEGLREKDLLMAGSKDSYFSLCEVGSMSQPFHCVPKYMPFSVWPPSRKCEAGCETAPRNFWCLNALSFPSNISCIKRINKQFPDPASDMPFSQHAFILLNLDYLTRQNMVTTLGSGEHGGAVYLLNLDELLGFNYIIPSLVPITVAKFDRTIWTADCNPNGTQAAIGTNLGAVLLNLETREVSCVSHSRSDIFSQQFDQSGNVILCGHRNGAVIAVDIRQRQSGHTELSAGPPPRALNARETSVDNHRRFTKQRFQPKRSLNSSSAVFMSSAVCSLVTLRSDDRYFLGSSMDGSIKLFDLRLLKRGAVQSYEGHVNSHTHLQLGVDPSETLVMSGGEDCCLRIWSIRTGELIFAENVVDSMFSSVSWSRGNHGPLRQPECYFEDPYEANHSWGAWLGSREGLFYVHGT